jgi:choline-glycine betaine transporter
VQPSSNHRNSDVVLIILTAHAGEDALAQVKKCRHYQSYLWGFHGWSNYRLIVAELSSGRIVHNRHGQILKKLVKKAIQ